MIIIHSTVQWHKYVQIVSFFAYLEKLSIFCFLVRDRGTVREVLIDWLENAKHAIILAMTNHGTSLDKE
jgi:hypothetical protein